jgi:hypothetical protein
VALQGVGAAGNSDAVLRPTIQGEVAGEVLDHGATDEGGGSQGGPKDFDKLLFELAMTADEVKEGDGIVGGHRLLHRCSRNSIQRRGGRREDHPVTF